MNSGIYYHILEIGFIYEKGRQVDERWHLGEKKRLIDLCQLWKNLIKYAALEDTGIDCSDKAFSDLILICKKHKLPNYDRVIALRANLTESSNKFNLVESKKKLLIDLMLELIKTIEDSTENKDGKPLAYKALRKLHNIPRALHGNDELGNNIPITCEEALEYANMLF